jgi:anti-sigma regulatory factor (Ser/Thr protein kinase)
MAKKQQITCAAELQSLALLRQFIDRACAAHPEIPALAEPQVLYDLKLAVEEACSNIIEHGYAGMNPGSIILALEISPRQVDITITDFGHPFEPSERAIPTPQELLEGNVTGGFGLFFIYDAMDEVDYETSEAGNNLYFVKCL